MTRIGTLSRTIRTRADLVEILPQIAAFRAQRGELLGDRHAAAALRVLAELPEGAWCLAVKRSRIDVDELALWTDGAADASIQVLGAVALALYGSRHPHPSLHSIIQSLSDAQFLAVVDGLRIAREGLKP
jgi:hypothetical protein